MGYRDSEKKPYAGDGISRRAKQHSPVDFGGEFPAATTHPLDDFVGSEKGLNRVGNGSVEAQGWWKDGLRGQIRAEAQRCTRVTGPASQRFQSRDGMVCTKSEAVR